VILVQRRKLPVVLTLKAVSLLHRSDAAGWIPDLMGEESGVDKCDILTCGDEEWFRVVESIHSIVEGGPSEGGVGQAETEEIPRYGQGKGCFLIQGGRPVCMPSGSSSVKHPLSA
jgi:hypothetical protein